MGSCMCFFFLLTIINCSSFQFVAWHKAVSPWSDTLTWTHMIISNMDTYDYVELYHFIRYIDVSYHVQYSCLSLYFICCCMCEFVIITLNWIIVILQMFHFGDFRITQCQCNFNQFSVIPGMHVMGLKMWKILTILFVSDIIMYMSLSNVSADREDVQEFRQHDKNNEIHFSFSNLCIPFLFGERFHLHH